MAVTAKVKIYSISPGFASGPGAASAPVAPEQMVSFTADYLTEDGKAKNAEWAQYTPSLNLTMSVKSEVVQSNGWAVGDSFTLTFEEAE